jgi:hypothetical protein
LYSLNPETAAQDHEFFKKANESAEFRKSVMERAMVLQHGTLIPSIINDKDFRQYWPEATIASGVTA